MIQKKVNSKAPEAYSEPVKHLRWSFLQKQFTVWQGSEHASGLCKVLLQLRNILTRQRNKTDLVLSKTNPLSKYVE